jgi:hypothetical protein
MVTEPGIILPMMAKDSVKEIKKVINKDHPGFVCSQ